MELPVPYEDDGCHHVAITVTMAVVAMSLFEPDPRPEPHPRSQLTNWTFENQFD